MHSTKRATTPGVPAEGGPAQGAAGRTEVTWWGHSAFVVRTPGGTVLAIDPWLSNPRSPDPSGAAKLEQVDYVLLTHGHPDHVGEAVAIGRRTGARLVSAYDLGHALVECGYPEQQVGLETLGNVGGEIRTGDATVAFVPAVHSSDVSGAGGPRPGGNPVGFVIRIAGGPTLYHTGDTDVFGDMRLIPERFGPIDVMMACIGGHFTMDPRGAALAARYVGPRTVVPIHWGTFPVLAGTPGDLEASLAGRAKVLVPEPGTPVTF